LSDPEFTLVLRPDGPGEPGFRRVLALIGDLSRYGLELIEGREERLITANPPARRSGNGDGPARGPAGRA
jgi:hypothetical protein